MKRRILYISLSLCLLTCTFYLYKLHDLASVGNELFEYRCIHVNPPLIFYKNAFLKYADFLNTYPRSTYTDEEVRGFVKDYIQGMREYVPQEATWLNMQKKFINRLDYRLIEPWYIKKAALLQINMYEAYKDDATDILFTFDNPQMQKDMKLGDSTPIRQRRDAAIKEYFDFFEYAAQLRDWRKFFGSVSIPKGCTQENMMIPNTSGSIDWDRDPNSATPSSEPIDPFGRDTSVT